MSIAVMAKKKQKPGPQAEPEIPSRIRSASLLLRSRPEWKLWVEELAEHVRAPSTVDLIDRALVAFARESDFPKPAPKR